MKKSALLYSNAFSSSDGGGIHYVLSIAHALESNGISVAIIFKNTVDISEIRKMYDIGNNVVLRNHFKYRISFILNELFRFTYVFHQSTTIPRLSFARYSFIICDFPFQDTVNFKDTINLYFYRSVIVNSFFTGSWVQKKWNKKYTVIHPPVKKNNNYNKQNIILSVGRIVGNNRSKNFPLLIENFKKMVDNGLKDWRFIIAGFVYDDQYLSYLKSISVGYPIHFDLNMPANYIEYLYSISSVYWHACGYHIDEHTYPHLVEHYGITIAQALVSGVVPLAISKGGAVEIIEHEASGFLWNEVQQLYDYTWKIVNDNELLTTMSTTAIEKSTYLISSFLDKSILSRLNIS